MLRSPRIRPPMRPIAAADGDDRGHGHDSSRRPSHRCRRPRRPPPRRNRRSNSTAAPCRSRRSSSATPAHRSNVCRRRSPRPASTPERSAGRSTTSPTPLLVRSRAPKTSRSTESSAARRRRRSASGPATSPSSSTLHRPPPGAMDAMGFTLSSVATTGSDAPPDARRQRPGHGQAHRVRPCRPAGVGGRRPGERRALLPRHGQQVQQRDTRRARGVQQVRGVDGLERTGQAAADGSVPRHRARRHRFPWHPDAHQRRQRVPDRRRTRAASVGWLSTPVEPRRPVHVGFADIGTTVIVT